jgi:hypothetical protein
MRRLPAKERNDIGFELHGLLGELLADEARAGGRPADDGMVLAVLKAFGTPAEVAARYAPPGAAIIPAHRTRSFAIVAIAGVALQWALTLPGVFDGQPLADWWLSRGLGALWWPGFVVMAALVAHWLRQSGIVTPTWKPRMVDPERINRKALKLGLPCLAIGALFVACLPWLAPRMPGALPHVFAFDPDFLRGPALPVPLLWLCSFGLLGAALHRGRWSPLMRQLEVATSLAWTVLLLWWLLAGNIFQAKPTDDVAKLCLGAILIFVVMTMVLRSYRRTKPRAPEVAR